MGSEKGECSGCCSGMGQTCGMILSVLVLLAGLSLLLSALGKLDANTGTLAAGVTLTLFGLGKIAHKMGLCSCCK